MDRSYAQIHKHEDHITVSFYNENDKPFEVGEKMHEVNEDAYMNGYNWDAFFNYYLAKHAPDVLVGMQSDPEAGMYAAHYDEITSETEARAAKFVDIIRSLIENEDELFRIVREESDEIEWD